MARTSVSDAPNAIITGTVSFLMTLPVIVTSWTFLQTQYVSLQQV
jgi:hypothetical protein